MVGDDRPLQLDYAQRRKLRRRRWFRWTVAVVGVFAGLMAWRHTPEYYQQATLLWRQDRVAEFRQRPDFVTYQVDLTRDVPRPLELLFDDFRAASPDYTYQFVSRIPYGFDSIGHVPAVYREFAGTELLAAQWSAVLYLGARQDPSGQRRIVVVGLQQCNAADLDVVFYSPAGSVYVPADWRIGSKPKFSNMSGVPLGGLASGIARLRFFAGQPDPADQTHFTIDYEVEQASGQGWQRYQVDGYLRDGDTVDLVAKGGVLAPRKP